MVDLGGLLVDPDTPPQAGEVSRAGPIFWISDSCVFLKVVGSLQTVKALFGEKV